MFSTVFLCNFISVTSSPVLSCPPPQWLETVTLTSSIFMTKEIDVTITLSTRTNNEHTTSSHSTLTQTASSERTTTPTATVVYSTSGEIKTSKLPFDYNSSATPTQNTSSEGNATPTQPVVYKWILLAYTHPNRT